MKKYKQSIQINKNMTDIFRLPCVDAIQKLGEDGFAVVLRYVKDYQGELRQYAFQGEWLCQDNDGCWFVLKDD